MLVTKRTLFLIFSILSHLDCIQCNASKKSNNTKDENPKVIEPYQIERRRDYSEWTSTVLWEEAPWMVGIVIYGRIWCAGSFITMWVALTAAHCFSYLLHDHSLDEIIDRVHVCTGCEMVSRGSDLRVLKILLNPTFTGNAPPYTDLAFVLVDDDHKLNFTRMLRPIDLDIPAAVEKLALPQSFVEITGWGGDSGTSEDFGSTNLPLRRSRLKVRKVSECKKAFAHVNGFIYDSEKYFCASFRHGKRDACVYDAGAPAVQNGVLVGMFIFGPHLCGTGTPAIFIKFGVLSKFIERYGLEALKNFKPIFTDEHEYT